MFWGLLIFMDSTIRSVCRLIFLKKAGPLIFVCPIEEMGIQEFFKNN